MSSLSLRKTTHGVVSLRSPPFVTNMNLKRIKKKLKQFLSSFKRPQKPIPPEVREFATATPVDGPPRENYQLNYTPINNFAASLKNQPIAHSSQTQSPATLYLTINQEMKRVAGILTPYNPDVVPYQHWLLRTGNTDPSKSDFREKLFHGSQLLRKHTIDLLWKIVTEGWEYDPPMPEITEWDADLEDAFIEATAKAMIVNTAAITRWADGSYRIFTTNDVVSPVYWNKAKKIAELYFQFPTFAGAVSQDEGSTFEAIPIGFLTQHSEESSRDDRLGRVGDQSGVIWRDCVLIQPEESIHDIFGKSKLQIECDTATQKTYLRSYEFAYLHKGGLKTTIAFNARLDKTMKDAVVYDSKRGIWSRGLVLEMNANSKPVEESVMSQNDVIPELGFDRINTMISEDTQLTKQKIEGAAPTGALGGQAPVVDKQMDDEIKDSLYFMCEKIIKDINFVFKGVEGYKKKELEGGRIVKEQTYRVRFFKEEEEIKTDEEEAKDKEMNQADRELDLDLKKKELQTPINQKPAAAQANSWQLENEAWGQDILAHSICITDKFVTYKGNLFEKGEYDYPKQNRSEVFTSTDINNFTKNPTNSNRPLEVSHSFMPITAALNNDLGYLEIKGFNKREGKDVTLFHINKKKDTELREKGIIIDNTIKVSPYFHRKTDPLTGLKSIHLRNAAILDPKKEKPRAEATGLKTEAILVQSNEEEEYGV